MGSIAVAASALPSRFIRNIFAYSPTDVARFVDEAYSTLGDTLYGRARNVVPEATRLVFSDTPIDSMSSSRFRDATRVPTEYWSSVAERGGVEPTAGIVEGLRRQALEAPFAVVPGYANVSPRVNPLARVEEALQMVRTGRTASGKKLSSAQRRQLAGTNEILRYAIDRPRDYSEVWRRNEPNQALLGQAATIGKQLADEVGAAYPDLFSKTLLRKLASANPYESREDLARMLLAAKKRAEKAEGAVPAGQMRVPGAPISRTDAVRKAERILDIMKRYQVQYEPGRVSSPIFEGRRGWMSQSSYFLGKSLRPTKATQGVSNWSTRPYYAAVANELPDEDLPLLRRLATKIPLPFGMDGENVLKSVFVNYKQLPEEQRVLYDNLVGQFPNRQIDLMEDVKRFGPTLTPSEIEVATILSREWADEPGALFAAAKEFG